VEGVEHRHRLADLLLGVVDVSICPFAEWKGPVPNMNKGGMVAHPHGLVPHVIVGSLRSADMIFHQASQQKSAHFGVAQIDTLGRLTAWLWSVSSFTLQVTNDVLSQGVISHRCGGLAWGAHTCPGDQRHGQRGEIVAKARAIVEHPAPPVVVTPFPGDHMKRLDMTERGLDNSGHGYTDLDVPAFTVVSVRVNTADYAPVPQCVGDQDFGGKARLEWVGPANAPAFSFRAWVAD
jgi:hypothetical protein